MHILALKLDVPSTSYGQSMIAPKQALILKKHPLAHALFHKNNEQIGP